MSAQWRVELHSHSQWSKDSLMRFERIMALCEKRGIDRLALTDHNTAEGALAFHKLAPELVIVGEEIMTTQGELLAYFVQETVPAGLSPEETIRRLRDQGAAISVSHPFDRLRHGAWDEADLLQIKDLVDAVEIFNARCIFPADNERAQSFADEHGLRGTAGSDAHIGVEYGTTLTLMRPFEDTAADFLDALQAASYHRKLSDQMVHFGSTAAKWSKKLGLRPRLWAGG
jgi:predicted metal-dependent phosphoesterase TrpH